MKKIMYRREYSIDGKDYHVGYLPGYKWISVSWHYPYIPGKYLVIDHYGKLKELYCTGMADIYDRPNIFDKAAGAEDGSKSYIDDRKMTDSDLMNLYRNPAYVWYYYEERQFYEDLYQDLHIVTPDNPSYPLYYLNLELDNTNFGISSEGELIDEVDKEPVYADLDGKIIEENPVKKLQEAELLKQQLDELNKNQMMNELYNKFRNKEDSDAEKLS